MRAPRTSSGASGPPAARPPSLGHGTRGHTRAHTHMRTHKHAHTGLSHRPPRIRGVISPTSPMVPASPLWRPVAGHTVGLHHGGRPEAGNTVGLHHGGRPEARHTVGLHDGGRPEAGHTVGLHHGGLLHSGRPAAALPPGGPRRQQPRGSRSLTAPLTAGPATWVPS